MNKKFLYTALCFTLCALLAVCSLSGCGKKKNKENDDPVSSTISNASSVIEQTGSDVIGTEDDQAVIGTSSSTGSKKPSSTSSNKTSTNTSSKAEQTGTIPDDWELDDDDTSSSSSKASSTKPTSSAAVSSSKQPVSTQDGSDILTSWPQGMISGK